MDYTGRWAVPWGPFTTIECVRDGHFGDYRIRATVDAGGLLECAEQTISGEVFYHAHDPWGIIEEVMIEISKACGVPPQDVERLVGGRQRIAMNHRGRNSRLTTDTEEPPSVICDQCSNAVHAVMEDGMLVFPVYNSTLFPTHQLCESCFMMAEQTGRAKVVTALQP